MEVNVVYQIISCSEKTKQKSSVNFSTTKIGNKNRIERWIMPQSSGCEHCLPLGELNAKRGSVFFKSQLPIWLFCDCYLVLWLPEELRRRRRSKLRFRVPRLDGDLLNCWSCAVCWFHLPFLLAEGLLRAEFVNYLWIKRWRQITEFCNCNERQKVSKKVSG